MKYQFRFNRPSEKIHGNSGGLNDRNSDCLIRQLAESFRISEKSAAEF
jgi:hypothetical protein